MAQECVKAITQKYTPIFQVFYYDAFEVLPDFNPKDDFIGEPKEEAKNDKYFDEIYVKEKIKTREIQ